jgi:hypothetical protein
MFGSLVICLPCAYTGGDLAVRLWRKVCRHSPLPSEEQENSIQWMAFFSDCDHEVYEVTSGTRITLTYNLYKRGTSLPLQLAHPPINKSLYSAIETLIVDTHYKGTLGIFLTHLYVSDSPLKGGDLISFNTATSLASKYTNVKVEKWFTAYPDDSRGCSCSLIFIPWENFSKESQLNYQCEYDDDDDDSEAAGEGNPDGAKFFCVDWAQERRGYLEERPILKYYGNDAEAGYIYGTYIQIHTYKYTHMHTYMPGKQEGMRQARPQNPRTPGHLHMA